MPVFFCARTVIHHRVYAVLDGVKYIGGIGLIQVFVQVAIGVSYADHRAVGEVVISTHIGTVVPWCIQLVEMQLLLLAGIQRCYVLWAGKLEPVAVAIAEYIQPALPPVERALNRLAADHALTVGAGDIAVEAIF